MSDEDFGQEEPIEDEEPSGASVIGLVLLAIGVILLIVKGSIALLEAVQ